MEDVFTREQVKKAYLEEHQVYNKFDLDESDETFKDAWKYFQEYLEKARDNKEDTSDEDN